MLPFKRSFELYRECKQALLSAHLKLQLVRAASSVALNIAEGYGKPSRKDRTLFFAIALGSIREGRAAIDLEPERMARCEPSYFYQRSARAYFEYAENETAVAFAAIAKAKSCCQGTDNRC